MALFIEILTYVALFAGGIAVGWWHWSTPVARLRLTQTVKGRTVTLNYRGPTSGIAAAWRVFEAEVDRLSKLGPVADADA